MRSNRLRGTGIRLAALLAWVAAVTVPAAAQFGMAGTADMALAARLTSDGHMAYGSQPHMFLDGGSAWGSVSGMGASGLVCPLSGSPCANGAVHTRTATTHRTASGIRG